MVQAFLAVAKHGSLSAAARASGASQPTLGRQIKAIEAQLGVSLFARQAKGFVLTDAGQAILPAATAMAEAATKFATAAAGRDMSVTGTVRITASVFVAQYILPQIIAGIRKCHPDIQIELNASDETDNLLFREADIALRMFRPTQLEIVTRKLGVLQLGFFASQDYIDRRGMPTNVDALMEHDLLGYDRSERLIRGAAELGWKLAREDFVFRCDQQAIHSEVIRTGCGIGILQKGIAQQMGLIPVIPSFPMPGLEMWLTTHEALRNTPRVRAVWGHLDRGLAPWLSHDDTTPIMNKPGPP
ncbi:LysR substrate-binding domain-containing protein [Litoreibacter sp.]|nr:LysR substrate-binding domain-containing protein [Litoreibacter sp.]